PRVDRKHREIVAETVLGREAKSIVIGVDAIIRQSNIRIERALDGVQLGERPPLLSIADCRSARNVYRRVGFDGGSQMRRLVAQVGGGKQPVPGELMLVA